MGVKTRLVFDRTNSQKDFQYIARSVEDGKLEIGYVAVDKPWYSPESAWKYYIISNEYDPNGFCGGSSDLGFSRVEVVKETIKPFNQVTEILYNQENDFTTILEQAGKDKNKTLIIEPEDEIFCGIWENVKIEDYEKRC